jgi:hypothetical protein
MNSQDLYNLQEAYLDVYQIDEGAAGDVAARAAKLARQRKGQTPERKAIYTSLAQKAATRERGPIPSVDRRKGLTSDERTQRRDDDAYHSDVNDGRSRPNQHGQPSYGKGGVTKNPRKLAQQKARGQHAESYDLYDIILSHLLDEGYAETQEQAEVMMVHMSEDWRDSIVEATAMAKRGLNEPAIRQQIAKNTGGGEFADKATALANKPTYGYGNPQARQNLARAQRGDFRNTTSSNPGLHGYAYKSNDPDVQAKQAARGAQRGVLTPSEKKKLGR